MKYPGHPTDETPPSWYHDRVQSYIEQEFQNATEDLASAIESEPYSTMVREFLQGFEARLVTVP
ncbi:hypothetical protein ACMSI6_10325 [Pseudomonas antarctica]|uniref:hypothetical protein n=1 Tax=Pseudomonas antarctica TaxID=219572 RepID=UPI0030860520|nr:hypothetical protein FFPRI1PSEUD_33350 [Pseudomonas sp. FFPRI_1]